MNSNTSPKNDSEYKPSSLASYKDLFDRLSDPILLVNSETLEVFEANLAAEKFFNKNLELIKRINIFDYFKPEEKDSFVKELRVIKRRYHPRVMEKTWVINEEARVLEIQACPLELQGKSEVIFQLLIKDITELRKYQKNLEEANARLEELTITDSKTGLFNDRYFKETLMREHERSKRDGTPYSLIFMDVDNFKTYNDTNGHEEGDVLLKQLADLLKNSVRGLDVPARYGGEEFVVFCPNTNSDQCKIAAERIRQAVENYKFMHREKQPKGFVSVSVGVASFPADTENPHDIKKLADDAMYFSKKNGRNQVTLYKDIKKLAA